MKQWLIYLMYIGPPSSNEPVDKVNDLRNDEEEAYEGLFPMENVGHHLWDHCV